MKKFEIIFISFIIRIVGCIICIYLINEDPLIHEHFRCFWLAVIFSVIWFVAGYINIPAAVFRGRFLLTLVIAGMSLALGFYFMHLLHTFSGLSIVIFGLIFSFAEHYSAYEEQEKKDNKAKS